MNTTDTDTRRRHRRGLLAATGAGLLALALIVGAASSNPAQAATLYSDNFEDGNADGWSKSGGDWSVVTDGSRAYRQGNAGSELARGFAGDTGWTNYQVQARVKPLSFNGSNRLVAIAARVGSATRMYRLALTNANRAELQAVNGSAITVIGSASLSVSTGTWYTLRLVVDGSSIQGFVNGTQVGSGSNSAQAAGRIALVTVYASAVFDDVSVDTVGSTPPTGQPTNPPTNLPTGQPTTPPPTTGPTLPPQTGLVGWATQNGGTSGGGNAGATTVTSASALTSAVGSSNAAVIRVSGTISCSGMLRVRSNKTIVGVGANATISGCGFTINGDRNVIIRNLNFRGWDDDAINVEQSATNIWVDHNSFTDGYDGAVDIKRGSDFVTVSWNRIYGHDKSMLLGHSDDNASQDVGHLRVSYHHNWFDGSGTRHPRVRFGNPVHVFNNYYYDNEYGVASTMNAGVLVEGNYFENVEDPTLVGYASSDPGAIVQRNNVFVGSGSPQSGGGSVAGIPYSYQLDSANSVKSIVTGGAGTGRIGL
ncbi:right-handed parallel beta-helix repeat-containing protein [Plantactinospora sp. WMMC1484]|uniref:pectate lyase family protein n=1 Tax=Plantactinospora sp. WMMC1484 TaxID=3404122 RepID=UPI003BF5E91A